MAKNLLPFTIDRDKYVRIAHEEGVNSAVTLLHKDLERWEHDTFEGEEGYQPQMFQDLMAVREFSRELWELALQRPELAQGPARR